LRRRGLLEFLLEGAEAAEAALEPLRDCAGRLTAATGLHAIPEERMVPNLRGIVEDRSLRLVLGRRLDDRLERSLA